MSWGSLFGRAPGPVGDSSRIPGPTPLQQQRIKQVESLRNFNQNVVEEEWDKKYSIEFSSGGQIFKLFVTLPPQFPNEKPIVHLSPASQHPWLDEGMFLKNCSSLKTFYIHSNLGKVIRQIVEDLRTNPPRVLAQSSYRKTSFPNYEPVTSSTPTAILISTETVEEDNKSSTSKKPSDCKSLEELFHALQALSIEELESLGKDYDKLLSFVVNLDEIKELQVRRKDLLESNRQLAEQNLSLKPKMEELISSLKSKSEKVRSLESELQSKIMQQNELFQVFELNQVVTNLRIAISQADESSEEIAENFLTKKVPVNQFLESFLEQRKLSHLRKAKEERIRYLNPRY
ncbi:vacuolar protein sorting-associated protein 37A-like [Rhopilema esculentum]|uniref:vacuolar protein sorting-associated protein 37A-like n=1 Tax=Rhopilema esculentum TaxID=499914 RepID=UPI0031DDA59A